MGGTAPTSPTVAYLKALNALAGTRFKIITGFPGAVETELAMQRGEVEGGSKSWAAMKIDNAEWLREKMVNVLVQYAPERVGELADVPLMAELGRTPASVPRSSFSAWATPWAALSWRRPASRPSARRRCARPSSTP